MKKAAELIVHYVLLSLERQGIEVTPDMRDELNDIVKEFEAVDSSLHQLHSLHP